MLLAVFHCKTASDLSSKVVGFLGGFIVWLGLLWGFFLFVLGLFCLFVSLRLNKRNLYLNTI